nr:hypothetical protein [Tanacetum cinerariifolium]
MAPLTFADTHKMIAFLTKSDASEGFDQIVDFLNAHTIQYALMVNPPIYVSCIKQFWASVLIKNSNDVVKLQALIDRKKVIITKDTIRQDLRLDDADGVDYLPNEEIFVELARMGYEKPMVRNVDSPSEFLMYPRFLQVMINAQVDDISSHNTKYTSPALTQKFFANIRRIVKGVETLLFDNMLVQQQVHDNAKVEEDEDDNEVPAAPSPPTPATTSPPQQAPIPSPPQAESAQPSSLLKLEKKRKIKSSGLKRLKKVGTTQRVESSNDIVVDDQEDASKQGGIAELDADEDVTLVDVDADIQERMEEDVTAIKDINAAESEPIVFDDEEEKEDLERAKVLQQQHDQKQEDIDWNIVAEQIQEKHLDNVKKYQSLKRKPISVAQARKNMIVYLKNMAGYKIQHFKGMTYDQDQELIRVGRIIQAFQSFEDMLRDFDRDDFFGVDAVQDFKKMHQGITVAS